MQFQGESEATELRISFPSTKELNLNFDSWTGRQASETKTGIGDIEKWAVGCVKSASWLPLSAGCEFTQPRAHLIPQLCTLAFAMSSNDLDLGFVT